MKIEHHPLLILRSIKKNNYYLLDSVFTLSEIVQGLSSPCNKAFQSTHVLIIMTEVDYNY